MVEAVLIEVEGVLLLVEIVVVEVHDMSRLEVDASNSFITCIFPVCHRQLTILFEPGSTYSYVSTYFAHSLDILCEYLDLSIHVSIHSRIR